MNLVWIILTVSCIKATSAEYCMTSDSSYLLNCEHGCCGTDTARVCCTQNNYTWVVAVSVTVGVLASLGVGFGIYITCNRRPMFKIETYTNKPPKIGRIPSVVYSIIADKRLGQTYTSRVSDLLPKRLGGEPITDIIHRLWKHCQKDWESFGLDMSTPSDVACKMYDATLTQIVNHYDDPVLGGAAKCREEMMIADPDFLMGHVLTIGTSEKLIHSDYKFAQQVYRMMELSRGPNVKPWERKHAEAVKCFVEGQSHKACQIWEDILVEKPTDILALKFVNDSYVYSGLPQGLRDSCRKVIPYWKPSMPHCGDVLSMYGFGLEEMNMYDQAEKTAKQALDINRHDAWASHCVAHVKEMTGQYKEGIKFMADTEKDWNDTFLLCHNYWHWALYYVETGEFETAVSILDNHVIPFMNNSKHMFCVTDAASLMFRLEAEGYDVGKRWQDCDMVSKDHLSDYIFPYYDFNAMLSFLKTKNTQEATQLMENLKQTIQENVLDIAGQYKEAVVPIFEAFQAYENGDYDRAVEIMKPLKYEIIKVGGSHAQRDLFTLFTVYAAMRSKKPENQTYARHLLMERKEQKEESPLADRLLQKLVVSH